MKRSSYTPRVPLDQADAGLNQANPVAGTWYVILAATRNCRLRGVGVHCTWTVQPDPIRIRVTVDGNVRIYTFDNPVSGTPYYLNKNSIRAEAAGYLVATDPAMAFFIEGRSILVEAEVGSTVAGTVSNLTGRAKYQTFP